jgi:hypothetical protein
MDITEFLKKPSLAYNPRTSTLESPTMTLTELAIKEGTVTTVPEARVAIRDSIIKDTARLTNTRDAIFATIEDESVVLQTEVASVAGKSYVTRGDYISGLLSQDPGAVMAREAYETYHSSYYNQGHPGNLITGIIERFKCDLAGSLDILGSELLSDDYLTALGSAGMFTGNPEAVKVLAIIDSDAREAYELRLEILRCGRATQEAMRANWILLLGLNAEFVFSTRRELEDLLDMLRKMRSVLKLCYAIHGTEFQSLLEYTRNYATNQAMDLALYEVYEAASRARNELIFPVVNWIVVHGNSPVYLPAEQRSLLDLIANTVSDLAGRSIDSLVDLRIRKQQRTSLHVASVGKVKSMLYMRGLIMKLDVLISMLPQVISGVLDPEWAHTCLSGGGDVPATDGWDERVSQEEKEEVGFDPLVVGEVTNVPQDLYPVVFADQFSSDSSAMGSGSDGSGFVQAWIKAQSELSNRG